MQSFFKAWLAEAPAILGREFGLVPSAHLPEPPETFSISVRLDGTLRGRFLVSAERNALRELWPETETQNYTTWRGVVERVSIAAARSMGGVRMVAIEDAEWRLGLPGAAYELRRGETVLRVALVEEMQPVETNPEKEPETEPRKQTSTNTFSQSSLDLLLDVELEASLRFGSREMPLNEVLELGAGDVIELDRHVSDPVDLLVGDKIVARGEVVLVNGSFGLRVLEVAEPKKCLESIRCLF